MAKTSKKRGYASHVQSPSTPATKKARADQIANRGGGYAFKVDDWTRLNRFLIIGNEGGTYYATEGELTLENYDCIKRCLAIDPIKTVDTIVNVSDQGRAIKNAPAIFALAVCSVFGDQNTRAYANKQMPKVCRFSTDMFTYVQNVLTLKNGKQGKGLLRSIGRWYTEKDAVALAYQICKYPQRSLNGQTLSHRDLLRMAHIARLNEDGKKMVKGSGLVTPSDEHALLFQYTTHGITTSEELEKRRVEAEKTGKKQESAGISVEVFDSLKNTKLKYVWAHEQAKKATKASQVIKLVEEYNITRESIPPQFRNDIEVQKVLLPGMPMTALLRNLGGMTFSGLLKPLSNETGLVIDKITNPESLKKARVHPFTILMAKKVYDSGSGIRTSWNPVSAISDALENAYYAAFEYVEPTGKKYLFGVDCSGSMGGFGYGSERSPLSPREAASAVAMTIARTEKFYHICGFTSRLVDLKITAKDSLATVIKKTDRVDWDSTNPSAVVEYAIANKLDVDVFVMLTDNEVNCGRHPYQVLAEYRNKQNPNAKFAVLAFTATEVSIADPNDAGMIDIAGLDSNVPKVLAEFAKGNL